MSRPIRRIAGVSKQIFLTFDDGPVPGETEKVLDILDQHSARATFFCIANQAKNHKTLLREIIDRGHSIGNHSLDHQYKAFFSSSAVMKKWVLDSQRVFEEELQVSTVGFRPPVGVITPPLTQVLKELEIPLIHWSRRFFDTSVPLNWLGSFYKYQGGDILLLHDKQRPWLRQGFYQNLPHLIENLADKGFDFPALTKENFLHDR